MGFSKFKFIFAKNIDNSNKESNYPTGKSRIFMHEFQLSFNEISFIFTEDQMLLFDDTENKPFLTIGRINQEITYEKKIVRLINLISNIVIHHSPCDKQTKLFIRKINNEFCDIKETYLIKEQNDKIYIESKYEISPNKDIEIISEYQEIKYKGTSDIWTYQDGFKAYKGKKKYFPYYPGYYFRDRYEKSDTILIDIPRIEMNSLLYVKEGYLLLLYDYINRHPFYYYDKIKKNISSYLRKENKEYSYTQKIIIQKKVTNSTRCIIEACTPFPKPYKACMIITDHADFDSYERFLPFYNLFNMIHGKERGLIITKSIFLKTNSEKAGIGILDDVEFNKLIDTAYHQGIIEVVPHGLQNKKELTPIEVENDLRLFDSFYKSSNWIDHSIHIQMLIRKKENNTIALLNKQNYCAAWSFFDVPSNAVNKTINLLKKHTISIFNYFIDALGYLIRLNIKAFLYRLYEYVEVKVGYAFRLELRVYIDSILKQKQFRLKTLVNITLYIVKLLYSVKQDMLLQDEINISHLSKKFKKYECQDVFYLNPDDNSKNNQLFYYITMRINNIELSFNKGHIDKLIKEKGINISHTYLCDYKHVLRGGLKKSRKGKYFISNKIIDNLTYIDNKIKDNILWNPKFEELIYFLKRYISGTGDKITLTYMK